MKKYNSSSNASEASNASSASNASNGGASEAFEAFEAKIACNNSTTYREPILVIEKAYLWHLPSNLKLRHKIRKRRDSDESENR